MFLLTGLWHGAAWNFVFWGVFHGCFLILERVGLGKALDRCPKVIRHLYTMLVVIIGWVFFRAENLAAAGNYIAGMFRPGAQDLIWLNYVMERKQILPGAVPGMRDRDVCDCDMLYGRKRIQPVPLFQVLIQPENLKKM